LAEIPELDFSTLQRIPNPYAGRTFVNFRVLESDVEAAFPDSNAVNQALRVLMALRDVVQAKPAPTKTGGARGRSTKHAPQAQPLSRPGRAHGARAPRGSPR